MIFTSGTVCHCRSHDLRWIYNIWMIIAILSELKNVYGVLRCFPKVTTHKSLEFEWVSKSTLMWTNFKYRMNRVRFFLLKEKQEQSNMWKFLYILTKSKQNTIGLAYFIIRYKYFIVFININKWYCRWFQITFGVCLCVCVLQGKSENQKSHKWYMWCYGMPCSSSSRL